jgi:hypothetical protein
VGEVLVKKLIILLFVAASFSTLTVAKKREQIKIKSVYKRSKKIWGVYTLNKQNFSDGKKKHRIGAKEDHVLLRKKGNLVFIEPEFKDGLISYGVKSVPYVEHKKKKISVEAENLEELNFKSNPVFKNNKPYRTISFKCENKWSKIECEQTLVEATEAELALE